MVLRRERCVPISFSVKGTFLNVQSVGGRGVSPYIKTPFIQIIIRTKGHSAVPPKFPFHQGRDCFYAITVISAAVHAELTGNLRRPHPGKSHSPGAFLSFGLLRLLLLIIASLYQFIENHIVIAPECQGGTCNPQGVMFRYAEILSSCCLPQLPPLHYPFLQIPAAAVRFPRT